MSRLVIASSFFLLFVGRAPAQEVQVSSPSTANQCETVIHVDPSNRLHLVGGANDARQIPMTCAFYASFDGGLTWSEFLVPTRVTSGTGYDPCAAIGKTGETYFAINGGIGNIHVGRSFDGGLSVPTWVLADSFSGNMWDDRPNLAIDAGSGPLSGAVYCTWSRTNLTSLTTSIDISASFDGGLSWTTPVRVSDSNATRGAYPSVGPNGELFVAFDDLNDSTIKLDRSVDGGATWHRDVKVADVHMLSALPNCAIHANSCPLMDVDTSGGPYHGNIYIVWADALSTGVPDVLMSRSTDGGRNWSTPIPVSDVTANSQFMPWVAVDPNGNVNFGFYDRRDDPNDVKIRYYVSRSSDGGVTFQPNVALSTVAFDPNSYSQGTFIGDFTSLAASDRTVHPLWADGRGGDNDIYTARLQLDIHTDVSSISATTGGTANITLDPGPLFQLADYRILGSISGTAPGIDFGPVNLPLNYDAFMLATILDANSSGLPGFTGTLDATGSSTAAVVSGPLPPAFVGLQMDFAAFVKVGNFVKWASNPTHLEIIP
jgi:hypothetical protein